jgi:ribosomal-protein-alanine N-acetyltransferase
VRKGARDSSLKNFKKVLSKRRGLNFKKVLSKRGELNFKKVLSNREEPQIRPAKKEDFAHIWSLEEICFKEETFSKRQLRYLLFKAKSTVLVALMDGKLIGSVIVLLRNHILNARIYSLNVHPAYRHAGVASLLMDTALKILKEKGYEKITLEVGVNNNAAQNLYRSKGFVMDKTLYNYYKSGDDAYHLVRKL